MPLEALLIPVNPTNSDYDGINGGTGCNFIFFIYYTTKSLAVIICRILSVAGTSKLLFTVETLSVAVALAWAVLASVGFVATTQPREKRVLVIYPIFLFYFAMSILTLATINSS